MVLSNLSYSIICKFPASYLLVIRHSRVNTLSVLIETMITTALITISFTISLGSSIPYFLLPQFNIIEAYKQLDTPYYLNKSVNLCNNFYDYACSNWISETIKPESEPFWNHWQSVDKKILYRIEDILKTRLDNSSTLIKVQNVFDACISDQHSEAIYIQNLKTLLNDFGGWPIVDRKWNSSSYEWTTSVAKITRLLGIYPFFKFHIFIDLYNTSQYIMYLEQGELNLPELILSNPNKYKNFIKAYSTWILNTVKHLFPNETLHNNLKLDVTEIVNFEIQLAKLRTYKSKIEKVSVSQLYKYIPLKWSRIFNELFLNTNIHIHSTNNIIIRNRRYLVKLLRLLMKTKRKIVANYVLWCVVKSLSRDITTHMRQLNFMMDNIILNIKEDISRKDECIKTILTYMDVALITEYSKTFLSEQSFIEVDKMINNIRLEFMKLLRRNSWLGNKTKSSAIEKINSLKHVVGYPKWVNNDTLIEDIFSQVQLTNNHFQNILQLRSFTVKKSLMKVNQPVIFGWPGSLFEVNAFYSILQNAIFIPIGMLEPPFFDKNNPRTLNYGTLGTIIGHEISHSLDVLGRHTDKNGNMKNWWSVKDIQNYDNYVDCFKKQYNGYNTNGITTVGENIADNVGLQTSYNALSNLKDYNIRSNLKGFSKEQLFFISFTQLWCEISSDNELINEEEYAPVKIRVQGTLENSKAFSDAFHCKNKNKICSLW